ncbi:MAG: hypothetical protein AAF281_14945, partial [Pseudomonadota bacterium]
ALGTVDAFVDHLRRIEARNVTTSATFADPAISDFFETVGGARYLIVATEPRVVDFRHFFAAAAQTLTGQLLADRGLGQNGRTEGSALMLGLVNELAQCTGEAARLKLNSCFAAEDMGSNRLGAAYGKRVRIATAEAQGLPAHLILRRFLDARGPKAPIRLPGVAMPGPATQVEEGLGALGAWVLDLLVPSAY